MNSATEMLRRQLHAYSEAWRLEQDHAVEGWELEHWIETGLTIFRLVRTLDERLGGGSESGEVNELYARWLGSAAGVLGRLNEMGAQAAVADAGEFRDAEREARGALRMPLEAVLTPSQASHAEDVVVPEIAEAGGSSVHA